MFEKEIDIIYGKLVRGISCFFGDVNMRHAVLGLSGGIDSAVVLCLAVEALGKESVSAVLMPSPFSAIRSVTDAVELAENLDIKYSIVPIEGIYYKYLRKLNEIFPESEIKELTLENLQSRIRGVLLMSFANQQNALLLNTSNKSEVATGYGTMYGDLCGALMVIADIYKLQVYALANYINRIKPLIPESILSKEPSAELKDNQKDSDTLPEYSILDPILYQLVERGQTPQAIVEAGADKRVVDRVVALNKNSSFKLLQLPPLLQVSESPLLSPDKCLKYEQ